MASIKAPKYTLSNSSAVHREFKPPSRSRSPASVQDQNKTLFQKSNLKAAPRGSNTYSKRVIKRAKTDSDSDGEDTADNTKSKAVSVPVIITEPAFEMPPDIDLSAFASEKSSGSKPSVLTPCSSSRINVFISPDDIHTPKSLKRAYDIENSFESPTKFTELSSMLEKLSGSKSSNNVRKCKFCHKTLPDSFTESPPTARRGRIAYCQRHENATTLEDGKAKGYPTFIDFIGLKERIVRLLPFIKKDVVNRSSESEFMKTLRKKTKKTNAANPMTMIELFDECQPGYYGPRGSEVISDLVLSRLGEYIRRNERVYEDLKFCGGVTGFISSVVVPEVGVRLIMEDKNVPKEEARTIMKDSVAYGGIVNASVEMSDEDEENESELSD